MQPPPLPSDPILHAPAPAPMPAHGRQRAKPLYAMAYLWLALAVLLLGLLSTFEIYQWARNQVTWPAVVGLLGVATSVLLAGAVWTLATDRQRARHQALALSADLELMSLVARYSTHAVLVTDPDLQIIWVNEAFLRLSGDSTADVYGRQLTSWARSSLLDPVQADALVQAVARQAPLTLETECRSKGARTHWSELELQPLIDAGGHFRGYTLIQTDIGARREATLALQQVSRQHEAFRAFLDQVAMMSETDPQGRILRVNDKFQEVTGYRADELVGQDHAIVNGNVHPPEFWDRMWETIRQGRPWRGEVCNRAKDGRLFWVDHFIAPFFDEDGRISRYLSLRTDITRYKNAEMALARSKDMLARTGLLAGVGGWYSDGRTHTVYMSAECLQIFGLEPEVGAGPEPVMGYFVPQARPEVMAAMAEVLHAQQPFDTVVELVRPCQQKRWIRLVGEPQWHDDAGLRLIGAAQDITAQVVAQRRIKESERTLRSAIDALGEAFALFDTQRRLVFCNDKFRQIYHIDTSDAVVGMTYEDLLRQAAERMTCPDDRGQIKQWVQDRIDQLTNFSTDEILEAGPDLWLRVINRTTPDGFHVAFRLDVSEMQQALRAADAASRSKSQFLASMSHEIRTPMNAMMGMLRLLEFTGLTEHQSDLVHKATNASKSLLDILNDILDFSKVEAGKMQLDPEPFVLDQLLGDLSVILSSTRGAKNLELVFDVDPAVPAVLVGDALRLKQVLINLCGNAIKFTSSGEVVLEVRVSSAAIGWAQLAFAVRDTGIGITPEQQKRIFSGFSQAEASTARRFGGTGLGLAISQRLVGLMGGELSVQSTPGQGSTFAFEITLPVGQSGGKSEGAASGPPMEDLVMLLVDDHETSCRALVRMLGEGHGWAIHAEDRYESAAAWVEEYLPQGGRLDVVLIDGEHPGVGDGHVHQHLMELVQRHAPQGTPPAVLTLLSDGQESLLAQDPSGLGAYGAILVKPVTASMVVAAVSRWRQGLTQVEPVRKAKVSQQRLQGVRLLLVEDNPINQEVAYEMLRREGAQVTVAHHGQAGVDAVQAQPQGFDLVLMDIQMPIMDGYQATQAIHRLPAARQLPIVAMTANAMQSDREACLAAGMVDHIGKPFDMDELVHAILRYTGRGSAGGAVSGPITEPVAARVAEAPQVFHPEAAIRRLGGDRAFFAGLVQGFERTGGEMRVQIETALQAHDWATARSVAHKLKSTAGTVGAELLAQACAAVELELTPPQAPALQARLQQAFEQALQAQGQWLVANQSSVAPPPAPPTTQAPQAAPGKPLPHQRLFGVRLLLAEDNLANQKVATKLLQREGATVAVAVDGRMAVDMVLADPRAFDVVLMDVQMPVMDGLQATQAIRRVLKKQDLPILAMTANAKESDRGICMAVGMDGYVGKPLDMEELVTTIRQYAPSVAPVSEAVTPTPDTDWVSVLQALYSGLESSDMQVFDLYDELVTRPNLGDHPESVALAQAMDAFDTDQAAAVVRAWLARLQQA